MANRYTNITPSQFSPLSMEETFMVPALKRKQHDDLLSKQQLIRDGLTNIDPLAVHLNEAVKLRDDMDSKINTQAENLAKNGINPDSMNQFLSLNKQYKDLTGPTGRIGKINNAKKVYNANLKEYIDDATKNKKWSREKAIENWYKNRHNKYTGYDDDNQTNITNIDQYGAPDKVELITKLKDIKSILGEQVVNEIGSGNYSITPGPNGSMQIVNRHGRRIETSNNPNIQDGLKVLAQELYDPNSAWRKSIDFEGVDPNTILKQTQQGMRAMTTTKVTDNRSTNASLSGYKNQADWDEQHAVGQLIENTTSFLPKEFSTTDFKANQKNLNKLKDLKANGNATKEQLIELDKLQTFQDQLANKLKTDTVYNQYKKYDDEAQNIAKKAGLNPYITFNSGLMENFADGQRWTFEKTADGKYQQVKHQQSTQGNWSKTKVGQPITSSEKNILERGNDFNKKMQVRQDEVTKENSVMTSGYGMFPTTKKEETEFKVLNNAFFTNLKADPQSLRKYLNIETVEVNGSNLKPSNNDKDELANLYSKYGENGNIISFIPKGFGGKPEYIIEFNTGDNSYNLDGVGKGSVGGEDSKVRMKVSFNKVKGNVLGNVHNAALNYISNKGEINPNTGKPIGNDLANEARSNIYNYSTYNDILNDQSYQWQNDELFKSKMHSTMVNSIKTQGIKSPFYGQPQSKFLEIFVDNFGNEFITK